MKATIYKERPSTFFIRQSVMDGWKIKVLPAEDWRKFSDPEIKTLMHETATYVLPTQELLDFLNEEKSGMKTIEVAAGNGFIGRNLGVPVTDSCVQRDNKEIVAAYKMFGQPTIKYPKDIIKLEANSAVTRFRPECVIVCYGTHLDKPGRPQTGFAYGIDYERLLPRVKKLILVGNKETHGTNPIMDLPHREVKLDGLITRSSDPETNRIFIWENETIL